MTLVKRIYEIGDSTIFIRNTFASVKQAICTGMRKYLIVVEIFLSILYSAYFKNTTFNQ